MHLGHAVEVVIGDSHILCVAGNIDHLEGQTTPPTHTHTHASSPHSEPGTGCSTFHSIPVREVIPGLTRGETGLEADLFVFPEPYLMLI